MSKKKILSREVLPELKENVVVTIEPEKVMEIVKEEIVKQVEEQVPVILQEPKEKIEDYRVITTEELNKLEKHYVCNRCRFVLTHLRADRYTCERCKLGYSLMM